MKYIFFAICLIITTQCLAQSPFTGKVTTPSGQPIPYANILLKGSTSGVTADSTGFFQLQSPPKSPFTLLISHVGFESLEASINSPSTQPLTFILKPALTQLAEITVTDKRSLNEQTIEIGKAGIKIMDLPQSAITIDAEVLANQQSTRLSDVLQNTSGIYIMGTTGGVQEEIAGRGFSYGSNNTFKNGVRFNNGVMPEVSALERVEVLKGSSAILFGNVAAGGVLNLVTKKPKFTQGGELTFRTGSFNLYKPSVDLYGALNKQNTLAYRFNSSYENAGSFRDQVQASRIYFNPSLVFKPGRNTEILLEGDYLNDARTLDYGIGAINYTIPDLARNTFLGAPWSYYNTQQKSTTITITHAFNEATSLRIMNSYQAYTNDLFGTTRPNGATQDQIRYAINSDGSWTRGLQRIGTDQKYYLTQIELTTRFSTAAIQHQFLVGAEYDQYNNRTTNYVYQNPDAGNRNVYDTISIYNPTLSQRLDIPNLNKSRITENPVKRAGIYIQDLITLHEKIKLLAGIRYNYIESSSQVTPLPTGTVTNANYYDHPLTSRVGIVYQPAKRLSFFSSYANSFTLNTNLDVNGNILPPSFINQTEAGIKTEWLNGFLSANLTAYRIVNSNLAQPVLGLNNVFELTGEVTSKGLELDVFSKEINGFTFIAGYSFNETRYTKSVQFIVGSLLRYNPNHTANASVMHTFRNGVLKGLQTGFTTTYIGDRVAGRSTRLTVPNDVYRLMPIPAYLLVDIHAGYTINDITIRVKVSNLLNELSYNVHDDNSVNPIAPRQFTTTLSYRL